MQSAKAQKQDTLLYYMKGTSIVSTLDSADYIVKISPPDSSSGQRQYVIKEFYKNGKLKLIGASLSSSITKPKWEGTLVMFYQNGNKQSVTDLKNATYNDVTSYYPNGNFYNLTRYTNDKRDLLIECRDSIGNILTKSGKGEWLIFSNDFKTLAGEGTVTDSMKNGKWEGIISDTSKYVGVYVNNDLRSGTGYDKSGNPHPFNDTVGQHPPVFKGGMKEFPNFIAKNMHYPSVDVKNKVQGKVIMLFSIDRSGRVVNARVLRAPSKTLAEEGLRVINLLPQWVPGYQYGMPVQVQYTIPLSFNL